MGAPGVTFEYGDGVEVHVPADVLVDLVDRWLSDQPVVAWGETWHIDDPDRRRLAAVWLAGQLERLAVTASTDAVSETPVAVLRMREEAA